MIYLWLRFEWKYAVGAVVALIHDILIVIGIMSICGREISIPVVAAWLTIIGYSLNDTIVVFGVGPGDGKEQLVVATACSDPMWSGYVQQQLAEATLCLLTISIPFPNQDLRFCFAALNTSRSPSTLS